MTGGDRRVHRPKPGRLLRISPAELRRLLAGPVDAVDPPSVSATVELLDSSPVFDRRSVLLGTAATALVLHDAETLRGDLADAVDHAALSDASRDDWEHTVFQHRLALGYRPAGALLIDLTADLTELHRVLKRRRAILLPTRLTRVAALLAGLMSATLLRLDQQAAARNWARTAKTLAREAGDNKLRAWVLSQEAHSHYYSGNLADAMYVATHAQHVANQAPCPGVAGTAALQARIHALHGRAKETRAALDRAEASPGSPGRRSSGAGRPQLQRGEFAHHTGNAYTHLGRTAEAFSAHERALALYPQSDHFNRPLVLLDRADCLVRDDDVPAATECATQASTPGGWGRTVLRRAPARG